MKFVAYLSEGRTLIGVVGADRSLFPIAEPADFHGDLSKSLAAAQKVSTSTRDVARYEERLPIGPSANVL